MADITEFPAHGKVLRTIEGGVAFNPAGTNYELHLKTVGSFNGPTNVLIDGLIRVKARKLWTVPSGGNFIAPIFGSPRTIQGRVRQVTEKNLVVQAGTSIIVELPEADDAMDLTNGAIGAGSLINIVALPGATFELLSAAVAR